MVAFGHAPHHPRPREDHDGRNIKLLIRRLDNDAVSFVNMTRGSNEAAGSIQGVRRQRTCGQRGAVAARAGAEGRSARFLVHPYDPNAKSDAAEAQEAADRLGKGLP